MTTSVRCATHDEPLPCPICEFKTKCVCFVHTRAWCAECGMPTQLQWAEWAVVRWPNTPLARGMSDFLRQKYPKFVNASFRTLVVEDTCAACGTATATDHGYEYLQKDPVISLECPRCELQWEVLVDIRLIRRHSSRSR